MLWLGVGDAGLEAQVSEGWRLLCLKIPLVEKSGEQI